MRRATIPRAGLTCRPVLGAPAWSPAERPPSPAPSPRRQPAN